MKRLSLFVGWTAIALFTGCSMFGPKPQVVYHKPKVKSVAEKVLMMPVTDFTGEKSAGADDMEEGVSAGWTKVYGADKLVPAGPAIDELNKQMGEAYKKIVSTLKKPSKVTKLKNDPLLSDYVKKVGEVAGDYNLAFAVVEGSKEGFENSEPVHLWLAVFDTRAFTWKWITKTEAKKGMFGGWESSQVALVSNSFDKAAEVDTSKVNMAARKPASK